MKQLRIFRKQANCSVLGPGKRAVVWVQGCGFRCPGCLVPESWNPKGGYVAKVDELVDWIVAQPDIEGVTFSGGEPFNQAAGLLHLMDSLQMRAPTLSAVSYTGYTCRWLALHGTSEQQRLLDRLDILIDGRYRQELHADLLWRGSVNQRIHLLSERYRGRLPKQDKSQGMELEFSGQGTFTFSGVPPWPDYASSLREDFVRV
jgi:anaerobic ribonucleoside-triphosphate reductase activating protein